MATGGRRIYHPIAIMTDGPSDDRWREIEVKIGLKKPIDLVVRETLAAALLDYSKAVEMEKQSPLDTKFEAFERDLRSALKTIVKHTGGEHGENLVRAFCYQREDHWLAEKLEELTDLSQNLLLRLDANSSHPLLRDVRSATGLSRVPGKQTSVLAFNRFAKVVEQAVKHLGLRPVHTDSRYIQLLSELTGLTETTCKSRIDELGNPL